MKRLFSLLLVVIMLCVFSACGDNSVNEPGANNGKTENISVSWEHVLNEDEYCTQQLIVTGKETTGDSENVKWTYTSEKALVGQLDTLEFLCEHNGIVYVNEQMVCGENSPDSEDTEYECRLRAIDVNTGKVLWSNTDYRGGSSVFDFDEDGTIYIGGYFGPQCMAIDKDGNTLWVAEEPFPDVSWLISLDVADNDTATICLVFECVLDESTSNSDIPEETIAIKYLTNDGSVLDIM